MPTQYAQCHPSGRRVDRVALRDPVGGSRVAVRVADDSEINELASAAGVSPDQVRQIVRGMIAPIAERVEREASQRLAQRIEILDDHGFERRKRYRTAPLRLSIDDWTAAKLGRGVSKKHADDCAAALTAAAAACGWAVLSDLQCDAAERYLADLRRAGRAPRTCQRVRNALVDFGRWCEAGSRIRRSPFAGLKSVVVRESERSFSRRSLTEQELALLLAWLDSEDASDSFGMNATARGALFALVCDLGLRRGEAAGLLAHDFDLDRGVLRVRAELDKTRRSAELPLRAVVIDRLRPVVLAAGDGPVFAMTQRTALMVRDDLAGARRWWIAQSESDDERARREASDILRTPDRRGEVLDFHALRATAATRLARAGVDPALSMRLLRHRCYSTTAGFYVRANAHDLAGAIAKLGDCA